MSLILDGTNGETFPSWTTAGRPASPAVGQMGYNTTIGNMEAYTSGGWVPAALNTGTITQAKIGYIASGGGVTNDQYNIPITSSYPVTQIFARGFCNNPANLLDMYVTMRDSTNSNNLSCEWATTGQRLGTTWATIAGTTATYGKVTQNTFQMESNLLFTAQITVTQNSGYTGRPNINGMFTYTYTGIGIAQTMFNAQYNTGGLIGGVGFNADQAASNPDVNIQYTTIGYTMP
jgi:hypothetical protein